MAITEVQVLYCGVCKLPPEYCLFGSRLSKCKAWLQAEHEDLYESIYGSSSSKIAATEGQSVTAATDKDGSNAESEATDKLKDLDLKKDADLNKEAAKKEAKAEAKEEKAERKRQASKVLIKRIERNKRKYVTAIHGLEVFGIDLKKASKLFANKFATGASVSKNNLGEDEIVIQGDVAYEVEELLQDQTPKIKDVLGGGSVPEDNVEVVDEKKKK